MNIYKDDSYFVIEHVYDDGRSNAQLCLPFNSVYLENIEDNVILVRSAKNNDVICTTTLDNLTINDEAVSLETLYEDFDAVATSAGGGSGPSEPDWFKITNLTDEEGKIIFPYYFAFTCEISTDGSTWTSIDTGSPGSLVLPAGGFIYFRNGNLSRVGSGGNGISCNKLFKVSGNIYHLSSKVLGTPIFQGLFTVSTNLISAGELVLPYMVMRDHCYRDMFNGCTSLTTAPALPATTLAQSCYRDMFNGCTSLTTAPALPATTLAPGCYRYMFKGCSNLTTAPDLLATTLVNYCCQEMFNNCTKLNSVKCLATTNLNNTNLGNWLANVSATGTFTKDANTTWSTGTSGIPTGWTVVEV